MPKLKIDLEVDSAKMEGQMASAGARAAAKFGSSFNTNNDIGKSLLKHLSDVGGQAGKAFASAFGQAGGQAGQEFAKSFKSSGAGAGMVQGIVGGITQGLVNSNLEKNKDIKPRTPEQQSRVERMSKFAKENPDLANNVTEQLKKSFGGGFGKLLDEPKKIQETKKTISSSIRDGLDKVFKKNIVPKNPLATFFGGTGQEGKKFLSGLGFSKFTGMSPMQAGLLGLTSAMAILVKNTLALSAKFEKLSHTTGYNVASLNALNVEARKVGSNLSEVLGMSEGANATRKKAIEQDPFNPQLRAFQRLGISREELNASKNPLELLAQKAPQGAQADKDLGLIIDPKMVQTFRALQETLRDTEATVAKLQAAGKIVNPEDVIVIKEAKDAFAEMFDDFSVGLTPIVAWVAKAAMNIIYWIKDVVSWIGYFGDGLSDIASTIGPIASAIVDVVKQMFFRMVDYAVAAGTIIDKILQNPSLLINPKALKEEIKSAFSSDNALGESVDALADAIIAMDDAVMAASENATDLVMGDQSERDANSAKRRKIANTKPNIGGVITPIDQTEQHRQWMLEGIRRPSDERIGIGNFLNQGSLSNVALSQLDVMKRQLAVQEGLLQMNREMNDRSKTYNIGVKP